MLDEFIRTPVSSGYRRVPSLAHHDAMVSRNVGKKKNVSLGDGGSIGDAVVL